MPTKKITNIRLGDALARGLIHAGDYLTLVKNGRYTNGWVGQSLLVETVSTGAVHLNGGYLNGVDYDAIVKISPSPKAKPKIVLKTSGNVTFGWKLLCLNDQGRIVSRADNACTWKVGSKKILSNQRVIETCEFGFHMSPTIEEAYGYVDGPILAWCKGEGDHDKDGSKDRENRKTAHRSMTIVKAWHADHDEFDDCRGLVTALARRFKKDQKKFEQALDLLFVRRR